MVIKIAWTGIRIDIEINTTASPKPNLYIYGHLLLTNVSRQLNGERTVFTKNGTETTVYPHVRDIEIEPLPYST